MPILVHGHRGARARLPENTLAAFSYAIEVGADAIELDIAVTRDNVLVVSHDPVLAAPQTVIRECSAAELNHRVPTVAQVLDLVAPHAIELNLELKSFPNEPRFTPGPAEFAAMLVQLLRDYRMESRAMVQSFDFRVIRAMRDLAPAIRRGALIEDDERDFGVIAEEAGDANYAGPWFRLVTPEKVQQAHEAGIGVFPWTVNAAEDWVRMAAAGVDAIITDDPAACLEWLRARAL
jgi:glycerophosphoryl diester phosphodiesterase